MRSAERWRKLVDFGPVISLVVLVLLVVAVLFREGNPATSMPSAAALSDHPYTTTIRSTTYCFTDAESLYAVAESSRSGKGVEALLGLAMREKAFELSPGDSVRVITTDPVAYVRVLTGFHVGRRCYTNRNGVRP